MPKVKEKKSKDKEMVVREVITLGSDPEFALIQPDSSDRVVSAHSVFKPDNPRSMETDFGYDGNSSTAEIRPKPTDSPKKAVQTIKKLLEKNKAKYPNAYKFNLMATSRRLTLGGHIHFGNENFIKSGGSRGLSSKGQDLVHNLDNLLAFPSMYLENKDHAKYRRSSSYGSFGDYRIQNWGFEYRTLSSFVASQELTSCIFHLAFALADATLHFDYKSKGIVKQGGFQYSFQNQHRELLKPHLEYVFSEHKKLPLYKEKKEYKKNIDRFDEAVQKEEPLFNTEIKEGWNIDFDITDFWKIDRLETLIDKILKLLISIHTLQNRKFKPISIRFVEGSTKDLGCREIAKKVNLAINNLVDEEVLKSQDWHTLKIYGLKEDRGNEVWIEKNSIKLEKRRKQVLAYFWDIASEFEHKTKIEEIIYKSSMSPYSMAFGRKLREENLLVAEAMVVIAVLMMNKELFKQTQKTKNGKRKKLLVTKKKVVEPVVDNLKDTEQYKAKKPNHCPDRLNGIKLPLVYDLDQSYRELRSDLSSMSINEKSEVSQFCDKKFRGVFEPLFESECINKCSHKHDLSGVPLKELCPHHLARAIRQATELLPNFNNGWGYVFKPSEELECISCSTKKIRTDFCTDCGYCKDCCRCYLCHVCDGRANPDHYCGGCERCYDCCEYCDYCDSHDCTHYICDNCGDNHFEDVHCYECDRCDECGHADHCPINPDREETPEPDEAEPRQTSSSSSTEWTNVPMEITADMINSELQESEESE